MTWFPIIAHRSIHIYSSGQQFILSAIISRVPSRKGNPFNGHYTKIHVWYLNPPPQACRRFKISRILSFGLRLQSNTCWFWYIDARVSVTLPVNPHAVQTRTQLSRGPSVCASLRKHPVMAIFWLQRSHFDKKKREVLVQKYL